MFRSVPIRIVLILALIWFVWVILATWATDLPTARTVEAILASLCVFLIIGLAAPTRAFWALRLAAGIIGIGFVAYFAAELTSLMRGERQELRVGQPSAIMAGLSLVVYAVPCLIFAASGFTGRRWRGVGAFWRGEADREDHDPAA